MDQPSDRIEVLLVDDDVDGATSTAARLERDDGGRPLRVETVADPAFALERIDEEYPDCVVTDYGAPGTDGIELLRGVRCRSPQLPVVFFTDRGSETVARDAFRAGVTDYVRKVAEDGQYGALAARVREAVGARRSAAEAAGETGGVVEDDGSTADPGPDRDDLRYRTELHDRVLGASTMLMSAEADEVDTKIAWTLETVGDFVGADRCQVFRHDDEHAVLDPTHQWTAADVDACDRSIDADPDGALDWFASRLARFENVQVDRSAALPDEAEPLRERCLDADVGSFLAVPLVSEWELTGALVFEVVGDDRAWTDHEVSTLRRLADMVGHTLARQRRMRELERRNTQLDEFASSVSHDLRNPLNVAAGFLSLARETGDCSHLDRAETAVDRMELLVDDLLSLARQGRAVGEKSGVDLGEAVRRAWNAVDTRDATLVVDADLGRLSADEPRLRAVFENLFRNAVEHAGSGATVTVGPLVEGGFFVADDGDGIPPADRTRVFDRGHTGSEDGTGFGLAIVDRVVDAHGWSVTIEASESGGACFEVRTGSGRGVEPGATDDSEARRDRPEPSGPNPS